MIYKIAAIVMVIIITICGFTIIQDSDLLEPGPLKSEGITVHVLVKYNPSWVDDFHVYITGIEDKTDCTWLDELFLTTGDVKVKIEVTTSYGYGKVKTVGVGSFPSLIPGERATSIDFCGGMNPKVGQTYTITAWVLEGNTIRNSVTVTGEFVGG